MSVKKINGKLVLVHYAASEYVLREESLAHVVLVVVDETRHDARQDGRGGERERVLQAVEDVLEHRVDVRPPPVLYCLARSRKRSHESAESSFCIW